MVARSMFNPNNLLSVNIDRMKRKSVPFNGPEMTSSFILSTFPAIISSKVPASITPTVPLFPSITKVGFSL